MNRSIAFGSFAGLLLTSAIGYYFFISKSVVPRTESPTSGELVEPQNLPFDEVADNYTVDLKGKEDLLAHTASLFPFIEPARWDSALANESESAPPPTRSTTGCALFEPAQALFLPSRRIEALMSGKQNVVVVSTNVFKCFAKQSQLILGYDELTSSRIAYKFAGSAVVERMLEVPFESIPEMLLQDLKMTRDEFQAFATVGNLQAGLNRSPIVLLLKVSKSIPTMDPVEIPPFAAGVEVFSAEFLASRVQKGRFRQTTLLDTRTRDAQAALPFFNPNFIITKAPITHSRPEQLKFRLDFPLELLTGLTFDFSALPASTDAPLILFGENELDPAPLWAARDLRVSGRRNLYIVRDGVSGLMKAFR